MGLCAHLPDLVRTLGCWLEDVGGEAIAAVGGWGGGERGGSAGVGGVCSPDNGGDFIGVACWAISSAA